MKVFHGSYTEIKDIDLSKAKPRKDFGMGFYVTKIFEDAKKMAAHEGKDKNCEGFVTSFEFDDKLAFLTDDYKTKRFEDGYTREWLDFVIKNRKNYSKTEKIHEYDIVEGPIADDVVAIKIRELPDNPTEEQMEKLLKGLTYYRYTHQICFCSVISLETIKRINLQPHFDIGHMGDSIIDYLEKDYNLSESDAISLYYKSNTYKNLSDENTELYKKSFDELYNMLEKEIEVNKK